jgi:hypothetical protein
MPAKYLKSSPRPDLRIEGKAHGCNHALATYEQVGEGHRRTTYAYAKPCVVSITQHMQDAATNKKAGLNVKIVHRDASGREWS